MATRYDPLSGRVTTTPDASSGVAGVDAAIAAAKKPAPVPTDPAKLAQFNVGQSAPVVEKPVVEKPVVEKPVVEDPKKPKIKTQAEIDKEIADKAAADKAAAEAKAKLDAEQATKAKLLKEQEEKRDAFALIEDTMRSYGFLDFEMKELTDYIKLSIMDPNLGPNTAILGMRNLEVYKKRFSGNGVRLKAGLNALSEYDYLQQENAYSAYFKEYGVPKQSTREIMGNLIGNDVSALELNKRLDLGVKQVKNGNPQILNLLKQWYPQITDKDLLSYVINPENTLPELQKKVSTGQIGAAFADQGLKTDLISMSDLAAYGVTQDQAIAGASNIATVLPDASKLSNIYKETGIEYNQETGTQEFLKSNAKAAQKRKLLASAERGSFEGSAGVAGAGYNTNYLKTSLVKGQI